MKSLALLHLSEKECNIHKSVNYQDNLLTNIAFFIYV